MFSNKVVIITGASSGIGEGLAIRFAKEQANVCITGRNITNLEKTARKCVEIGGNKPIMVIGDVTNDEHLKDIVNSTINAFGKIDILINNAGILKTQSLEQITADNYDDVFNTNVRAVVFLSKLVAPYLIQTKGNIVNVSSLAGMKSYSGSLSYNMSKAALDQFTKCTALELAQKGVRVNSVNPGYIPTNIMRSLPLPDESFRTKIESAYKTVVPLGRNGTINDVVEAVLYLANENSSFITGHLLPIDGGRNLVTPRPDLE
ncbi:3-oxoacyl-[acyl-carrier-protein] reductase FabG-like [Onthophagus taurus]|uniref:3-oxoacyl-[acyl-carrier-protein] reductase FabG-like n=1 Tax=Onthophagus taurus TaxID=166361 RepID=UPI0039BE9486